MTQQNKLPDFSKMGREEETTWWETHEVTDYLEELKPVNVQFALKQPKQDTIVVRLQTNIKNTLEKIARQKGLTVSSLARMWLMEKLQTTHV